MQIVFDDKDLTNPLIRNLITNILATKGVHPVSTGNGEDLHPEPFVPSAAEPSPITSAPVESTLAPTAAPTGRRGRSPRAAPATPATPLGPSAVRQPGKRGRMSNEEKAQLAALRAAQDNAPADNPVSPIAPPASTFFPPGISTQAPAQSAPAAMPPTTPPTGDTLTELQEWGRRLDSKRPGATFQILSDSGFIATAGIPPERVPEFVMRFKSAHDQL
jgi:hypothetical protein